MQYLTAIILSLALQISFLIVIFELVPNVLQLLPYLQSVLHICCDSLSRFVQLSFHLLPNITITLVLVFSKLLILLFSLSFFLFFILPSSLGLPSFLFFSIFSYLFIWIFTDSLLHCFSESSLHSLSFRLLILLSHSLVCLLGINISHKLLSKRFVFPSFFRLIPSVVRTLSRVII